MLQRAWCQSRHPEAAALLRGPRRTTAEVMQQARKQRRQWPSSFEARAKRREHLSMTVIALSVSMLEGSR
jgi:hypothetical protein